MCVFVSQFSPKVTNKRFR